LPVEKGAQLIAEDILRDAREKAAGIISDSKKEARKVLDAARVGAKEEEERETEEARAQGKHIQEAMLAEGRMRTRRELLQKREELINEVLKEVEKELRAYTSSEKYEKDLTRMAVSACKKLGSNQVVIRANRRDLKLLEKSNEQILRGLGGTENGASISFGEPLQTIGGVRVGALDGNVEIDETFDGKIRREFEVLRVKVAKVLFEGSK
jgi:V/A-type H+-transporting ATPase subunit E